LGQTSSITIAEREDYRAWATHARLCGELRDGFGSASAGRVGRQDKLDLPTEVGDIDLVDVLVTLASGEMRQPRLDQ
jgi:hypothetical protein